VKALAPPPQAAGPEEPEADDEARKGLGRTESHVASRFQAGSSQSTVPELDELEPRLLPKVPETTASTDSKVMTSFLGVGITQGTCRAMSA